MRYGQARVVVEDLGVQLDGVGIVGALVRYVGVFERPDGLELVDELARRQRKAHHDDKRESRSERSSMH